MGLDNVAVQWPRTGRFYEPASADEFSDFAGKLCALPLALQATSLHPLIFRSRRACRPDRVGRCA